MSDEAVFPGKLLYLLTDILVICNLLGSGYVLGSTPSEPFSDVSQSQSDGQMYATGLDDFHDSGEPNEVPKPKASLQPPKIITHPQDQSMIFGDVITLKVAASGSDLHYTWFKDGIELTAQNFGNCSGFHTPSLRIENFLPENAGKYSCMISNSLGRTESWEAKLTLGKLSKFSVIES